MNAWSPTNSYAPGRIECPSDKRLTRVAEGLSSEEHAWLEGRNPVTQANLIKFLQNANMTDFDAQLFVENAKKNITIGLAFSGGGYRAMLCGAGQLAALDSRTTNADASGLGGLLQASTYLVGLSGGNWLVGTIAMNNFTSVEKIVDDGKIWDLERSIINPAGWNVVKLYKYYNGISDDLNAKKDAGFDLSLTDTWARMLSHQFFSELNDTGAALTWSTLQESDPFTNHEMPFPIVVADGRTPNSYIISGNSTVFETNPFELGSWDPSVYQFTKVKYLGTNTTDGEHNGTCVGGFDNAGYVMGTSSTLFNQFVLQINTTSIVGALKDLITHFLNDVSKAENDIAIYKPNPFHKTDEGTISLIAQNDTLYLVDGGEDLQNVPIYPLIQPERKVDVIFAYDNSGDTDQYWPNGASLVATYERQFLTQGNGTYFPHVPDVNTFRNLNLTAKPAFFGCDAKNLSLLFNSPPTNVSTNVTSSVYDIPLVVYTANRPFSFWSNTSTFDMDYTDAQKKGMIRNGYEVSSRLNKTLDSEWAACVGCAIIRREQERQSIEQSEQCKRCFARYCWNGELDSSDAGVNFTTDGTTNGPENDGNRTVSAGLSITIQAGNTSVFKAIGYALLCILVLGFSI